MQSYKGRFEPTRFEDLTVTVDFHCHSACRFCIVQEGMNLFKGVPLERFKQVVDDNSSRPRYRRVTFTGGEVTLERRLFDYIGYARQSGGFEHIRVQTNGRLLADMSFARKLVDAGVDEYFVSLHGHDAKLQDYISQRPGSFDEAIAGLENLQALGMCIMTNTVLTTLNVNSLADIVDTVRRFAPRRMEFWNYLPMQDYADELNLIAPMSVLAPALREALGRAAQHDIPTAVKYVPQCLLGEHTASMDNTQPDVVIVEDFYEVYPQFGCLWEAKCEHSETCLGLHHPYITKFGWEQQGLVPTPRTTPWREPEYGPCVASDQPSGEPPSPRNHPEWHALVDGVAQATGARLVQLLVDRRHCIYRFELEQGTCVDIVLTSRSQERPALVRTASFDVHYRNVVGDDKDGLRRLIQAAAQTIAARDGGGLLLDERKGLVGPEALRRKRSAPRS
jgi:MoaA/NifB/PqqE/SkfB family radical SAM enzyme